MFNKTLAYARLEWFLACQKVRRTEPLAGHGKLDPRKIIGFVLKKIIFLKSKTDKKKQPKVDCLIWRWSDSNRLPFECHSNALARWATPPKTNWAILDLNQKYIFSCKYPMLYSVFYYILCIIQHYLA